MSERHYRGGRSSRRRSWAPLQRGTYIRKKPMTVSQLQNLQEKDPLHVVLTLKSENSGFNLLISRDNLENYEIKLILKVIGVACESRLKENLSEMLRMVSGVPRFMNQLGTFISGISQDQTERSLKDVFKFLEALSRANPMESRQQVENFLLHLSAIAENNNNILIEKIDKLKCMFTSQIQFESNVQRTEKSFRRMSIYPGQEDFQPDPNLQPNLVKGKYSSVENYLDVQFRLFREDFVRSLRESIMSYRRQRESGIVSHFRGVRVYNNVRLSEAILTVDNGLVHKVRFRCDEKINWEAGKRLIYGSMVCLSVDGFKSMLVATVVASRPSNLKHGIVQIRFSEKYVNEAHRHKDRTFVAIEPEPYFECYRHVLSVLQEFEPETFPMKEYIVDVSGERKQPRYLCGNSQYCFRSVYRFLSPMEELQYKLERQVTLTGKDDGKSVSCQCLTVSERMPFYVLEINQWPEAEYFGLDKSQMKAFKSALTQKLSLIQGPPGTGKTHVGLKIINTLLHNKNYQLGIEGKVKSPILVVCYTNHALDQFLEGVLDITDKVVRVGSRSGSEALSKHNLKSLRQTPSDIRNLRAQTRRQLEMDIGSIEKLQQLEQEAHSRLLKDEELKEYIPKDHWSSLLNDHPSCMSLKPNSEENFIHFWLGSVFPYHFYYEVDEHLYLWLDDTVDEIVNMLQYTDYSEFLCKNIIYPESVTHTKTSPGKTSNPKRTLEDVGEEPSQGPRLEEVDILEDAQVISGCGKTSSGSTTRVPETFVSKRLKCEPLNDFELCRNVWALRLPDRWRLYKAWLQKFFVGTAGKLADLKQQYKDRLELYDELRRDRECAVTQTHEVIGMTTTGAAKYKHLIRGLKPRVVIVEEAAEVLEAHIVSSLSENTEHLILIGDHQQLRPNPACYELVKDYGLDVSLFERLVNNGLSCCRLGIQHRMRPSISQLLVPDIYSKLENHSSVFEYEDVRGMERNVFFLNHSVQEKVMNTSRSNEYEADFLVMLCKHFVLQGYRPDQITILSTYLAQIVLIKTKAAAVPLITGAKITVVDNYQGEENDIVLVSFVRSNEKGSIGFLKTANRVCVALSRAKSGLYCVGNFEMLGDKSILWKNIVTKLQQEKSIGSDLNTKCQIHGTLFKVTTASDFDRIPGGGCDQPCNALLRCGHICTQMCHPVDPEHEKFKCLFPCTKINPSCAFGHACILRCYADCGPCLFKVLKVLSPCQHQIMLSCSEDAAGVVCTEPCPVSFQCGHRCPSTCGEPCSECSFLVYKTAPCGHAVTVPCFLADVEYVLTSACKKPCDKILECGHRCTAYCGSDCVTHCSVIEEKELPCGHLNKLPCSRRLDSDEDLMKACSAPCNSPLFCGHKCKGTCGDCMQGRLHVPCKQSCKKELLCGHTIKNAVCFSTVPSCKALCRSNCDHARCLLPCSCICVPCKLPCSWSCEHYQCSKMCDEVCDRPACELPCSKTLPCGHRCLGYCGETCPLRCAICDKGTVVDLNLCKEEQYKTAEQQTRLIMLDNCGHIFFCEDLETWLKQQFKQVGIFKVIGTPKCPVCKVPIRKSGRLGVMVQQSMVTSRRIKKIMFGSSSQNELKRRELLRRLNLQLTGHCDQSVEQFLQQLIQFLNKNKSRHMLLCVENYRRVCEELSTLRSTLRQRACNTTSSRSVREVITAIVRRFQLSKGRISQQLIHDFKKEIWELHTSLNCDSHIASFNNFVLISSPEFLVGNWYLCINQHICFFPQCPVQNDMSCEECELSP